MIRLTINALWLALLLLPQQAAIVGVIDSPECRRDLAMAGQLVHAVRLRENSVQPGDFVGLCRLLRQNLQDMTRAREPMARCMTGHELGENVGQMDASIDDIRFVLSKHCVGRWAYAVTRSIRGGVPIVDPVRPGRISASIRYTASAGGAGFEKFGAFSEEGHALTVHRAVTASPELSIR